MIIVCPGCTAHYGIDREIFGFNARIVRCSACDYEWEAAPDQFGTAEIDPAEALSAVHGEERAMISSPAGTEEPGSLRDNASFDRDIGATTEATEPLGAGEHDNGVWEDRTTGVGLRPVGLNRDIVGERAAEPNFDPQEAVAFSEPGDDSSLKTETVFPEEAPLPSTEEDSPPASVRSRRRLVMAATGGVVALVLGLGILVAAEGPITRALPGAAAVYSVFGLAPALPGSGLDIRDVTSNREWSGTEDVLIVAGIVANVATGTRGLPPLRVTLFDGDRSEIQAVVVQPVKTTLAAGETVPFVARFPNPSIAARRVVVSFQLPSAGHG